MQYLSGITQRKTLLLACAMILAGCGILGWSLVGRPATIEAAAPQHEGVEDDGAPFDETGFASAEPVEEMATAQATTEPAMLVYVSGAVRAPDVYRLPADARVKDVVLAAGGFADGADPDAINLAARLDDGQHIHVPWQGQAAQQEQASGDDNTSTSVEAPDALLDLNRADASDLEALPGIGSTTAERIIAYRDEHGPFTSIDELKQVKGIGPALFAKIAPLVRVGS